MQMGAKSAIGIDIDRLAIAHSISNAKENSLDCLFFEVTEADFNYLKSDSQAIALMNMIWSEQKEAYSAFPVKNLIKEWITSGILQEERQEYLNYCTKLGWKLIHESADDGWCAFHFVVEHH